MVHLIESGDIPTGSQLMENHNVALRQAGKNLIRQAQDRAVDISGEGGEFVEAFVDERGQLESVVLPGTDATFSTDEYRSTSGDQEVQLIIPTGTFSSTIASCYITVLESSNWDATSDAKIKLQNFTDSTAGTLHDPDSYTNPTNAFDGDSATYAEKTGAFNTSIGKTFSAKTVEYVHFRVFSNNTVTDPSRTTSIQTYNGSTWTTAKTIFSGVLENKTFEGFAYINSSVQGIRVNFASSNAAEVHRVYLLMESTENETTGYLNKDEVSEFTAFTSEPQVATLQITKGTGTTGIKGVAVFE